MSSNLPAKQKFVKPSSRFNVIYILSSVFLALISENIILTFFSLMTILISIRWVWRVNEPPILAFVVFYHWVQISMKILHANLLGVNIQDIAISNSSDVAIFLSLIGLMTLSYGIHIVLQKVKPINLNYLHEYADKYTIKKLFIVYVFFFIFSIFLKGIWLVIPGLAQIIVGVLSFKIVLIYFIFLVSLLQKKYKILTWIIIIETLFGLTGFFSSFKQPYMLLFLAYFTINYKVSFTKLRFIIPLILFVILMGLTWTAIKSEYRYALNQGGKTQTITVSVDRQIELLLENIGRVDLEVLGNASEALAYRLAYVDFFGQVIDYVPKTKAYEYGNLWFGAVTHIFKPRIFFPDKPILDDSLRTSKYTGHRYAALDEGTSIGIGYFAESYIDFGPYGMFFPLFLLGIFYGVIYRYLIKNVKNPILAYSMIVAILLIAYPFETRNDKIFGGIVMALIMLLIMKRLFMTKLFASSLTLKKKNV